MDGDSRKEMTPVMSLKTGLNVGRGFRIPPEPAGRILYLSLDAAEVRLDMTFASLPTPLTLSHASSACPSVQFLDKVTSWLPEPRALTALSPHTGPLLLSKFFLPLGSSCRTPCFPTVATSLHTCGDSDC